MLVNNLMPNYTGESEKVQDKYGNIKYRIENVEIFDLSLQSPSAVSTLAIATREIAKLDKANINIIFNN